MSKDYPCLESQECFNGGMNNEGLHNQNGGLSASEKVAINAHAAARDEADRAYTQRLESASFADMDKDAFNRLNAVRSSLLEGSGMREIENMLHDDVISQEDFDAFKRVFRTMGHYLNQYSNVHQREAADKDAKEIKEIEKRLAALKGTDTPPSQLH